MARSLKRVRDREVPDSWREWIAESRLQGFDDATIVEVMTRHGVLTDDAAWDAVRAFDDDPAFHVAQRLAASATKLEALLDVYQALERTTPGSDCVERVANISEDDFLRHYYSRNRPVILTGMMDDWPAMTKWTPEFLRSRYGDELVEVQFDRKTEPIADVYLEGHTREIRFGEYIDLVLSSGSTNEFYLTANDRLLERPSMAALWDDFSFFPNLLNPGTTEGKVFLWFGPAGTISPLHRDKVNVLMTQVSGRKRVTLVSSNQLHRVYNETSFWSEVDAVSPDYEQFPRFADVHRYEVLLEPGEALFLPVAWWHRVEAVDISINVSFTNFLFPNTFEL